MKRAMTIAVAHAPGHGNTQVGAGSAEGFAPAMDLPPHDPDTGQGDDLPAQNRKLLDHDLGQYLRGRDRAALPIRFLQQAGQTPDSGCRD